MTKNISDNIILILPAKSEFVSTVRLTAASLANRIGFNIDEVEDIKVAISEVCNIILSKLSNQISQYQISFEVSSNELGITFNINEIDFFCFDSSIENEYGLYIMKALMDSVEISNDKNSLIMVKRIGD